MRVYITPKNPIDSEFDEMTLMPENEADQKVCETLSRHYEAIGAGYLDDRFLHVSIKLTEKQKDGLE